MKSFYLALSGFATVVTLFVSPVGAESSPSPRWKIPSCETAPWPFKRDEANKELHQLLTHLTRRQLQHYLLHEVTQPQPKKDRVAAAIAHFLRGTAATPEERLYYSAIIVGASLTDPNVSSQPTRVPLNEFCSHSVGAHER